MSEALGTISEERSAKIEEINDKLTALSATLEETVKAAMTAHADMAKEIRNQHIQWWIDVEDDLGLDHDAIYIHSLKTGEIRLDDSED